MQTDTIEVVTSQTNTVLESVPTTNTNQTAPANDWVEFRNSDIHGHGGFARKLIPNGTEIIEYVGRIVTKEESAKLCEKNNEYIFDLNEEFDLDGKVEWNPARLINHGCDPNCYAEQDGDRIFIFAGRDIQPGEELTFNYGFSYENYEDYPCLCGASQCIGFMVGAEHHGRVRKERGL